MRRSTRRVIHQIAYKRPTPACERTLCGLSIGGAVKFRTFEPRQVSCARCRSAKDADRYFGGYERKAAR